MPRKRINEDRVLTGAEKKRRHDDLYSSIDDQINNAVKEINWERRKKAESSFYDWVCTYGFPSLLNTLPPENAKVVL